MSGISSSKYLPPLHLLSSMKLKPRNLTRLCISESYLHWKCIILDHFYTMSSEFCDACFQYNAVSTKNGKWLVQFGSYLSECVNVCVQVRPSYNRSCRNRTLDCILTWDRHYGRFMEMRVERYIYVFDCVYFLSFKKIRCSNVSQNVLNTETPEHILQHLISWIDSVWQTW